MIAVMVLSLMGNNSILLQPYVFNGLSFFGWCIHACCIYQSKAYTPSFVAGSAIEVALLSAVAYLVSNEITDRYICNAIVLSCSILFYLVLSCCTVLLLLSLVRFQKC